MRANRRAPAEIPMALSRGLEDDVRHLPAEPGDVERCRCAHFDAQDVVGRDHLQLPRRAARFIGHALAVDQNILRRLTKAALGIGGNDGEARHLHEHVVSGLRREPGKELGREHRAMGDRRFLAGDGKRRVLSGRRCAQPDRQRQEASGAAPPGGRATNGRTGKGRGVFLEAVSARGRGGLIG